MLDISAVILTYNEEIHIQRCIENIKPIAKYVFLVDSSSTDKTVEIAVRSGASIFQNQWPGNQAAQFNWALENLPIKTEWVLRIDADEYLYPELIEEITQKLDALPKGVTGVVFKRRHIFLNKWMKRGTYPVKLLRLFRHRKAVCEQLLMDEHIYLLEGELVEFDHDFADHNLNNLNFWIQKHNGYAIREAADLLDLKLNFSGTAGSITGLSEQAATKRKKKIWYAKQPLFWRSFAYFVYRYFFKLGFLEGKEGFLWHFLQGWWYRTLVDAKIYEIKEVCGTDQTKIKEYFKKEYSIEI